MRKLAICGMLGLLLPFAGCLEAPPHPEDAAGPESTIGESSGWAWATAGLVGPAAFTLRLEGAPDIECQISIDFQISTIGVLLFEAGDGSRGSVVGTVGYFVGAHVDQVIDTRGDGSTGGTWRWNASYDPPPLRGGWLTLTLVSDGFAPHAEDSGNASVALSWQCTDPVLWSLKGSREVLFLTPETSAEGAGVWAPSPTREVGYLANYIQLLANGAAEAVFTSPQVELRGASWGIEQGTFTVIAPDERHQWDLAPDPGTDPEALFDATRIFEASAGPGEYRMELTRVAGLYQSFWAVLFGLQGLRSLDDLVEAPA